jgi:dCTP deaminase
MILTGTKILEEVKQNRITLDPFSPKHISTNSYDLTLGDTFIRYKGDVLDTAVDNEYEEFRITTEPLVLERGDFVLGHSVERIGSDNFVPIIHARSGVARMGLFVHVTADLIDIGSHGNVTFQFFSTLPIRITPGMKIAQVSFWEPIGEIELYRGKYQNSRGPMASRVYSDFQQEENSL